MTLHLYDNLEQGSEEWLAARCGLLTASQIGKLITPTLKVANNETSRGLTETLVAERITDHVEYVHPSFDMQRGTMDEPYARDLYSEHHAPVTQVGFAVREIDGHKIGASPDGLVGAFGGIEIKSRAPKMQLHTILTDTVPTENIAQIQALMFVFDRDWWEYVSYAGGWPLYTKRVYRDTEWQTVIRAALNKFEADAARMIAAYNTSTAGAPIAPRINHYPDVELKL